MISQFVLLLSLSLLLFSSEVIITYTVRHCTLYLMALLQAMNFASRSHRIPLASRSELTAVQRIMAADDSRALSGALCLTACCR